MLYVLIAEAALELIPADLTASPQVERDSKKRAKRAEMMLLDSSRHWEAMEKIPDKDKRGRPDIAHFCLLTAMESVANKTGNMNVLVHTQGNELLRIDSGTRLPRIYERFCGLVEDTYFKGKIIARDGKELMSITPQRTLERIMKELPEGTKKILLDPSGEKNTLAELSEKLSGNGDFCIAVGGFAHGKIADEKAFAGFEKISVSPLELAAWTALGMAVYSYESTRNL